jgi:hypothetical protein
MAHKGQAVGRRLAYRNFLEKYKIFSFSPNLKTWLNSLLATNCLL